MVRARFFYNKSDFRKSENLPLLLPKAKTSLVLCTNFTVRMDNFTFAAWQKLHLSSPTGEGLLRRSFCLSTNYAFDRGRSVKIAFL